jgi:hypothetical protein
VHVEKLEEAIDFDSRVMIGEAFFIIQYVLRREKYTFLWINF